MKRLFPVWILACLLSGHVSFGQNYGPDVRAEKLFNQMAYNEAIEEYQKVLAKQPENAVALRGIAECYRLINNTEMSEQYYAKVVKLSDARPSDKLNYAQALMYNAKYDQAKELFTEYSYLASTDERAQNSLKAISRMNEFFKDSAKANVSKIAINSDKADFSPVFFNNGVVFTSSRESGAKDRTHSWTGNPFLTLYYAQGMQSSLRTPELFSKEMESKFNDGPVCFNAVGTEMYLTRNNDELSNRTDKVSKLKIVNSKFTAGKWSDPQDMPFVNSKYNTAHAYITPDGNRLFFASDMPGGYGGMDIYFVNRTQTSWSSPINAGDKINTKGNELFPFVGADSTLYFASNGHEGLGGLDIYKAAIVDNTWTDPVNMGYPVNTHKDDFGLVLDHESANGYMSSNRAGGMGDDDIYFVQLFKNIFVSGTVTDKKTGKPIDASEVVLMDREGKEIARTTTAADGRYEFELEFSKDYNIAAQKIGYSRETKPISTVGVKTTRLIVDFQLERISVGVEGVVSDKATSQPLEGAVVALYNKDGKQLNTVTTKSDGYYYFELVSESTYKVKGTMEGYFAKSEAVSTKGKKEGTIRKDLPLEKLILNKPIRLDNIYYDLDKWNIRPDAAKELDKLVQVLKDNPTVVIELSSHTDCRATDQYNLTLSDKRAKSAAKYIIEKGGISKERVTGKGYGETMLINRCANGVKCSESEHQENRRTEFKVLKF